MSLIDDIEAQIEHNNTVLAQETIGASTMTPKTTDKSTSAEIEHYLRNVANGQFASYWLKDAIKTLLERDCVDAARDAEFLGGCFQARADAILREHTA